MEKTLNPNTKKQSPRAENLNLFFMLAFERPTLMNSIRIAIIVGIILNLINQGDLLVAGDWEHVNKVKFFLTFLVPFSVSTYSAGKTKMSFIVGQVAGLSAEILCKTCGGSKIVEKGEIIEACENCDPKTNYKLVKQV